jgi:phosphoglycolate phosphatase (TIGR01487 family)
MEFRALATDVDGTLTDRERGISLTAIQAIRDLEARGVPVILASARPFPILNILREYIGCSGAIVCENGGFVEYKGKSCTVGDRTKGLEAYRLLKEKHGDNVKEAWTNRYNFVDVALARTIPNSDVLSVVEEFPTLKLLDSGFFYHIMPTDVEKGRGLMAATEMMGMEADDLVAIGDSQVDIELLQAAGFGVAVSDASEDLKRVANSVTEKPDGEGVSEVIRRMF